jgi:hypothetical protein
LEDVDDAALVSAFQILSQIDQQAREPLWRRAEKQADAVDGRLLQLRL